MTDTTPCGTPVKRAGAQGRRLASPANPGNVLIPQLLPTAQDIGPVTGNHDELHQHTKDCPAGPCVKRPGLTGECRLATMVRK